MAHHVAGQPYRYRHGWIPIHPEISKADLSTPDARRSRAVSSAEFQQISALGAAEYEKLRRQGGPTTGLDKNWGSIVNRAYIDAGEPWGGATIDAHTGEFLTGKEDKYAITVRPPGMDSVTIPANANPLEFRTAMNKAKERYSEILQRKDHYLGVFHDADKNTIDIDPVLVTDNKSHVETIGAYTHAVGGAYHFKSGDGFWPPHVDDSLNAEAERLGELKTSGKATDVQNTVLAFDELRISRSFEEGNSARQTPQTVLRQTISDFGEDRSKWPKEVLKAAEPYDPLSQLALSTEGVHRTKNVERVKLVTSTPGKAHRKHETNAGLDWQPVQEGHDEGVIDYGDIWAELKRTQGYRAPYDVVPQRVVPPDDPPTRRKRRKRG